MSWVRIHDAAMTHPKIIGLSDSAFRAWVWGLSYAQTHLTDGLIPTAAVDARFGRRAQELMAAGLWTASEKGFQIHDYLDWNDSRDVVLQKRHAARSRATDSRQRSARAAHVPSGVVLPEGSDKKGGAGGKPRPQQFGRISLHRWMLDQIIRNLGPHADAFDLDAWVYSLPAAADAQGMTFPTGDFWPWVQEELKRECQRRGLPVANADTVPSLGKQSTRLLAAIQNIARTEGDA